MMHLKHAALKVAPAIAVASLALNSLVVSAAPITRAGAPSSVHSKTVKKAAVSTTELFAGGATLPALAYEGAAALTGNPVSAQTAGSVFNYYATKIAPSGTTISYCQTGSGFGKKVLDGVNASGTNDANLTCAPLGSTPVQGTDGFGATGQNVADFAGSDAPFASSEYSSFVTNGATSSSNPIAGKLEPVQIPVLAGSIALLYNNDDPNVEALANLPLDDTSICKMAAGTITTWPALETQLKSDGVLPSSTAQFASKNLYFVSRYDGSGTSFSFTNHLASVCSSHSVTAFGVNQTFSAIIPQTGYPTPATFYAASGNPGVVTCITKGTCLAYGSASPGTSATIANNGDGAIGYVEAGNAKSAVTGGTGGTDQFATVGSSSTNQMNPITNLPAAANTIVASDLLVNMVVNQNTTGGPPSPFTSAQTPGVAGTSCLLVVNPADYANPASGYPIIAVTNLEFSYADNLGKSSLDKGLATVFSTPADFGTGKITTVDTYNQTAAGKTGYSTVNLSGSTLTTAINCIGT